MRLGPFWWLEPIEYGFHKSQSTQRPSRPPQTRIIVRSRAIGGRSASALHQGIKTAAPAPRPALIRSRRPRWENAGRSDMSRAFILTLRTRLVVTGFRPSVSGCQATLIWETVKGNQLQWVDELPWPRKRELGANRRGAGHLATIRDDAASIGAPKRKMPVRHRPLRPVRI